MTEKLNDNTAPDVSGKYQTTGSVPDEFRIAMRYAFAMGYSQGHNDTFDGAYEYTNDEHFKMADKIIDEAFAKSGATHLLLPL